MDLSMEDKERMLDKNLYERLDEEYKTYTKMYSESLEWCKSNGLVDTMTSANGKIVDYWTFRYRPVISSRSEVGDRYRPIIVSQSPTYDSMLSSAIRSLRGRLDDKSKTMTNGLYVGMFIYGGIKADLTSTALGWLEDPSDKAKGNEDLINKSRARLIEDAVNSLMQTDFFKDKVEGVLGGVDGVFDESNKNLYGKMAACASLMVRDEELWTSDSFLVTMAIHPESAIKIMTILGAAAVKYNSTFGNFRSGYNLNSLSIADFQSYFEDLGTDLANAKVGLADENRNAYTANYQSCSYELSLVLSEMGVKSVPGWPKDTSNEYDLIRFRRLVLSPGVADIIGDDSVMGSLIPLAYVQSVFNMKQGQGPYDASEWIPARAYTEIREMTADGITETMKPLANILTICDGVLHDGSAKDAVCLAFLVKLLNDEARSRLDAVYAKANEDDVELNSSEALLKIEQDLIGMVDFQGMDYESLHKITERFANTPRPIFVQDVLAGDFA